MHTFEPHDYIEVGTPHGLGIVLYITVYGGFANDIWCVANKADGQLRHYQTIQLTLTESGVLGMNEKPSAPPTDYEDPPQNPLTSILLKRHP